jgi:GH25 family lysozyme M1 (1,4-beta-N-acetylmuramidase)
MIKGIDVASYQAETFATSGLDFVFVKATEGTTYINPKMRKQAATARTAGLVLGFYHFLHPGDIKAQARYFVEKCASLEGDLLVCDWETTGTGGRPTNAEKDAFLKEVKRLRPGHKVGLYCNRDYWLTRDSTSYAGDFLWIADPTTAGKPRIKAKWLIHQYAVSGGLDRNVADFNDRSALRAWAGQSAPAPKPDPAPTLEERVSALEVAVKKLSAKK